MSMTTKPKKKPEPKPSPPEVDITVDKSDVLARPSPPTSHERNAAGACSVCGTAKTGNRCDVCGKQERDT